MEEYPPLSFNGAKYCWMAPIGAIVLAILYVLLADHTRSQGPEAEAFMPWIFFGTAAVLCVTGIASGLAALRGVKEHGKAGIYLPARIGIAVNVILIISAIVFMLLRA
jgi:hypothetical protein